jgi:hypothetical protein
MLSSAPAMAMLPPRCPIDPGVGLWNWPPTVLPSGPTMELRGPSDDLFHEAIFYQPVPTVSLSNLSVTMVVDRIDRDPIKIAASSEIRVIDVSATTIPPSSTVDQIDFATAEVTAPPADDTAVFSYGNTRMTLLPPSARDQFSRFVERLMDHAVNYLLGEAETTDLKSATENWTFALKQMRGDTTTKGRSPARGWSVNSDSLSGQAQKIQRMLKVLRDCVSATIVVAQIEASLGSYVYTDEGYRYVFREWYGGDGLIVQMRTPGGYTQGRMAFNKAEVEAARVASGSDVIEARNRADRNRGPFRPATTRPADRLQSQIDGMNQQLKHKFFGGVEGQVSGNA